MGFRGRYGSRPLFAASKQCALSVRLPYVQARRLLNSFFYDASIDDQRVLISL